MASFGAHRGRTQFCAECESCGAVFDSGNRDNDRMAARRHAEKERHVVCAVTERLRYYDGSALPYAVLPDEVREEDEPREA